MNYANQICEMLEVKVDTPFRCKEVSGCWYKITENCDTKWDGGTNQKEWFSDRVVLMHLLDGTMEIEHPKKMTLAQIQKELGYTIEIIGG